MLINPSRNYDPAGKKENKTAIIKVQLQYSAEMELERIKIKVFLKGRIRRKKIIITN